MAAVKKKVSHGGRRDGGADGNDDGGGEMEKIASRGVASSGGHMVWKCPSSFFLPSSLQVSHPPRCLRRRQRFFECASEREWGLLEGGGQRMGAVAVLAVIVACDIVDKPKIIVPRFVEFFFC